MCIEGGVRIMAGIMVLAGVALGYWINAGWLLLAVFVGLNLIQSAFTGFCPASMLLKKAGLQSGTVDRVGM